ncbi:MAG: hypothetical protein ABSG43_28170 [Solirubrobacteraceae bacterium]
MLNRPLHHIRQNVIAYLALFLATGAGGGYALAAANPDPITVCVDKGSGVLHLDRHGRRCKRTQTRVSWNQAGSPGPPGPTGAPAVRAWATVTSAGQVVGGEGLSVQHVSTGRYLITVTLPGCGAGADSAPVVSISNAYPPNGQYAGTYPVSWVGDGAGAAQFDVNTGLVVNASYEPADQTFNVQEACS